MGNDSVSGGAGSDVLDGDEGDDTLSGGDGNDDFFAGDGNDEMFGDAGTDELFGGQGADFLSGGAGDDELEGEEGADTLEGGGGDDQFNFFTSSFQPDSTFAARDVVLDFSGAGVAGGDVIQLSGDDAYAFAGKVDVTPRVGATLGGANDHVTQVFYAQTGQTTYLIADENDNGILDADDFAVEFQGRHDFTVDDFTNTDFVIAGTNGDDSITGTEDADRSLPPAETIRFSAWVATTKSTVVRAMTRSTADRAVSTICSAKRVMTRLR